MLNEAVVFPAPLQPQIMYSFLSCMRKVRELYSHCKGCCQLAQARDFHPTHHRTGLEPIESSGSCDSRKQF